jgi:hypothetical protein
MAFPRRLLALVCALACVPALLAAAGTAEASPVRVSLRGVPRAVTRHVDRRAHVTVADAGPLRFGVYPWAAPGAVGDVAAQLPDVPDKALAAVQQLAGGHPLTVHLYGDYTGTGDAAAQALLSDARWWSDNGLQVEMVLRYRPASPSVASGYGAWVGSVAGRLAQLPGLVSLQIGNEANNTSSPAAGDGAYPGAVAAIAHAVPVARQALDAAGRQDVGVGINWAAGESPCGGAAFWIALRRAGGPALASSLGWVGVDVYPGTWSGPSPNVIPTADAISRTVVDSLRCLRDQHMTAAGLSPSTSITVSETGYPTDAARSPQLQASVLRETVATVQSVRARFGIDALNWFSLRDGNTASGQLQNGYGLLRDDYAPKPAFTAYQDIIAAQA